ncbi:hypothetical protein Godav_020770, partial [Gossypium davidsonii]|nr:hypothetical protein [Gossypium davidsonii]MBA0643598.1 hypothetical protein [Gossypium klotzschianum]
RKDTLNQSQTKINPRQTKIYKRREEEKKKINSPAENQQRAESKEGRLCG